MPAKTDSDTGFKYLLVSLFLAVLAFFILLNSISQINQQKTEDILEEVRENFSGDDIASKFKILPVRTEGKDGVYENATSLIEVIKYYASQHGEVINSKIYDHGKKLEIKISQSKSFYTSCCDSSTLYTDSDHKRISAELDAFKESYTRAIRSKDRKRTSERLIKRTVSDFIIGLVDKIYEGSTEELEEILLIGEYAPKDEYSSISTVYKLHAIERLFVKQGEEEQVFIRKAVLPKQGGELEKFVRFVFYFK